MKKVVALFQIMALMIFATYTDCNLVEASQYAEVYGENITGSQGEEITIPVMISGNEGIMGFQLNIAYDERSLVPVSVINKGLTNGILDYNIRKADVSNFDVLWSGTDEIRGDGILFDVVFKVSEYAKNGTTKIDISYLQEDTFDGSYQDVKLKCNSFNITIDGEPMEIETPAPTSTAAVSSKGMYTVFADDLETKPGQSIAIPVKIENNLGIMGFLMFVKYDVEVLEPVSVAKGEVIPDGTTFDDNCTMASGDTFKILWAGIDEIDTDGCLYTLNFRVKEGVTVSRSIIELSYNQTDTFDGSYGDVVLDCKPIALENDIVEHPTSPPTPEETERPETPTETEKPGGSPAPPNAQQGITNSTNVPSDPVGQIQNNTPPVIPKANKVALAKVSIKKVRAKGKRQIQVTWKKQKNVKGYQLQYATNKQFRQKKTKNMNASKGGITLKKLKPKKYYYIRIRSYTYYGGKKIYGKWCKVKKCKVK